MSAVWCAITRILPERRRDGERNKERKSEERGGEERGEDRREGGRRIGDMRGEERRRELMSGQEMKEKRELSVIGRVCGGARLWKGGYAGVMSGLTIIE